MYQTIGLVATNFFKQKGIACSLYVDDRVNGELFTKKGFWSRPIGQLDSEYNYKSAKAALHIICKVLTHLGYFLGLKTDSLLGNADRSYIASIFDSGREEKEVHKSKREHPGSQILNSVEIFIEGDGKVYIFLVSGYEILYSGDGACNWKGFCKGGKSS